MPQSWANWGTYLGHIVDWQPQQLSFWIHVCVCPMPMHPTTAPSHCTHNRGKIQAHSWKMRDFFIVWLWLQDSPLAWPEMFLELCCSFRLSLPNPLCFLLPPLLPFFLAPSLHNFLWPLNILPQISWLKTTHIYSIVLEVRGLKWFSLS